MLFSAEVSQKASVTVTPLLIVRNGYLSPGVQETALLHAVDKGLAGWLLWGVVVNNLMSETRDEWCPSGLGGVGDVESRTECSLSSLLMTPAWGMRSHWREWMPSRGNFTGLGGSNLTKFSNTTCKVLHLSWSNPK